MSRRLRDVRTPSPTQIVYERFDFLYKTELGKREGEKNFYRQEELFLILYDWLTAAKEFQVRGIKLGDVRPSQMVITSSTKRIKLINTASFPWEMCAVDKILDNYDNTTKFYLSPEEVDYVKTPARNAKLPNSKTEAFSLGLSILEAALLENSEDLYANSPRVIDLQELTRRIERLGKKYPLLKHYVSLLLKLAPEERYSSGELWSVLKIYSVQITDTKPFTRKEAEEARSLQDFRKNGNRG